MNKKILLFFIAFFLFSFGIASAHLPRLIYLQKSGDIFVSNPEISQAFYDELKDSSKNYIIESDIQFNLYLNLLVPTKENANGRYSAKIYKVEGENSTEVGFLDGNNFKWEDYYEEFGRDYYVKGPEFDQQVDAGKYKIEVFSKNQNDQIENKGKYVLAIGKTESFDWMSVLNIYWQIPTLKLTFFKSDILQFFLTKFAIFGIAALGILIIFIFLIYFVIGAVRERIKHNQAKTLLLTSSGMDMKEEIVKLLQKPAYDITVAFITTAAKAEEDVDFVKKDYRAMKDLGFNIEEFDIEGKREFEVMNFLKIKDIIFVEGGNTFYLMNSMRKCNFERIIRRLLKEGIVYIGSSAGSVVAGKTIQTSYWKEKDIAPPKNLKGLNLVPYDIFVHYTPEYNDVIKDKIKNPKKRAKNLRILTDQQALIVQGKDTALIGKGEQVVV